MKGLVAVAVLPASVVGMIDNLGPQSVTLFGMALAMVKLATSLTDLKERVARIESLLDKENK